MKQSEFKRPDKCQSDSAKPLTAQRTHWTSLFFEITVTYHNHFVCPQGNVTVLAENSSNSLTDNLSEIRSTKFIIVLI